MQKRVMIYGAGQAGEMAASWLPGDCVAEAFVDQDPAKQGGTVSGYGGGLPILSPGEAFSDPEKHPDAVFLCVINQEAAKEIRRKLAEYGFAGEIVDVPGLRKTADLRLSFLRLYAREIRERDIIGDLAELGVYRGDFAREMNRLFPDRELLLFDTFEGFDERDLRIEREKAAGGRNARASAGDFGDTSAELVRSRLPFPGKAVFLEGYFPESIKEYPQAHPEERKYAIVSLDTDLCEPTLAGLSFFWPRMAKGGVIIIHDYNSAQFPGVRRAVREFAKTAEDVFPIPLMDLHGTAVLKR